MCTEYMYVYSAHCLLYKSVSMYCLYVNCVCTVWSTLSRICTHLCCDDVTIKVIWFTPFIYIYHNTHTHTQYIWAGEQMIADLHQKINQWPLIDRNIKIHYGQNYANIPLLVNMFVYSSHFCSGEIYPFRKCWYLSLLIRIVGPHTSIIQ